LRGVPRGVPPPLRADPHPEGSWQSGSLILILTLILSLSLSLSLSLTLALSPRRAPDDARPGDGSPHQRYEHGAHLVQLPEQPLIDLLDVPERQRDIETSARLSRRTERRPVPRLTRASVRAAPFGNVQRDTGGGSPKLIPEIPIVPLDLREHPTQRSEHPDHRRIDLEHDVLLAFALRAKAPASPRRAQG
jgi:hypothetical protein